MVQVQVTVESVVVEVAEVVQACLTVVEKEKVVRARLTMVENTKVAQVHPINQGENVS